MIATRKYKCSLCFSVTSLFAAEITIPVNVPTVVTVKSGEPLIIQAGNVTGGVAAVLCQAHSQLCDVTLSAEVRVCHFRLASLHNYHTKVNTSV